LFQRIAEVSTAHRVTSKLDIRGLTEEVQEILNVTMEELKGQNFSDFEMWDRDQLDFQYAPNIRMYAILLKEPHSFVDCRLACAARSAFLPNDVETVKGLYAMPDLIPAWKKGKEKWIWMDVGRNLTVTEEKGTKEQQMKEIFGAAWYDPKKEYYKKVRFMFNRDPNSPFAFTRKCEDGGNMFGLLSVAHIVQPVRNFQEGEDIGFEIFDVRGGTAKSTPQDIREQIGGSYYRPLLQTVAANNLVRIYPAYGRVAARAYPNDAFRCIMMSQAGEPVVNTPQHCACVRRFSSGNLARDLVRAELRSVQRLASSVLAEVAMPELSEEEKKKHEMERQKRGLPLAISFGMGILSLLPNVFGFFKKGKKVKKAAKLAIDAAKVIVKTSLDAHGVGGGYTSDMEIHEKNTGTVTEKKYPLLTNTVRGDMHMDSGTLVLQSAIGKHDSMPAVLQEHTGRLLRWCQLRKELLTDARSVVQRFRKGNFAPQVRKTFLDRGRLVAAIWGAKMDSRGDINGVLGLVTSKQGTEEVASLTIPKYQEATTGFYYVPDVRSICINRMRSDKRSAIFEDDRCQPVAQRLPQIEVVEVPTKYMRLVRVIAVGMAKTTCTGPEVRNKMINMVGVTVWELGSACELRLLTKGAQVIPAEVEVPDLMGPEAYLAKVIYNQEVGPWQKPTPWLKQNKIAIFCQILTICVLMAILSFFIYAAIICKRSTAVPALVAPPIPARTQASRERRRSRESRGPAEGKELLPRGRSRTIR
jgi:hypothetical protein